MEHYEISCYGTARAWPARSAKSTAPGCLSHTLGEEESADFLLTAISDPLLQQVAIEDSGNTVNLENTEKRPPARRKKTEKLEKAVNS